MIEAYWQERGAPFEDSDGEKDKVSIDSQHPTPKLDRLDGKRYADDLTVENGETSSSQSQSTTTINDSSLQSSGTQGPAAGIYEDKDQNSAA